ncbi:diacylglycerol O-acyltransferase 1C-like isoform X2 [Abrus precatorius]|uniref:O-acyltransferase n=1 Tax=Abrus precatorius TaxID=3816 RepID=A0A8B8M509_ABRPR|nr:diacylglycerol O-acyltransferase 1C-like isoform X2 [Abrus precatorius]
MAISESLEGVGTAAIVQRDSDLQRPSLRRRSSATSSGGLFDADDAVRDSGSDDSMNGKSSEVDKDRMLNHEAADNDVADREPVPDFKFAYRPSVPAHRRIKESPLSSDNIFKQSHAGLFNLCIVVLVAVNSRLIIENLMKYGWLIKYGFWFSSKSLRDWPLFMCCLSLNIFPLAAFAVERLAQQKCISEPVVVLLHVIITTVEFSYPVFVILRCDSAFLSGVTLMLFTCIVWLKLVSYAHTNYDMRALSVSNEKGETLLNTWVMENPHTVSFKSLAYFMFAPTLCYQALLRCRLNILAELLRFGDREFYKDWWNAKTVEEYWRMWNMPVHKWMVRHIYFPCLRSGIHKRAAALIAFLVSAVFHEFCIAVPCHMFKLWAFIGIMFQVPLVLITNYLQNRYRNSMVGNMIFWFIFCILGQPMCVLLYYHDLMNRKGELD